MDALAVVDYLKRVYGGEVGGRNLQDDEVAADVMCRVMTVPSGQAPTLLSESPGRKTVFVAGRDTVCNVLPCRSAYDMLREIGLTPAYIAHQLVVKKCDVWLCVFQANTSAGTGDGSAAIATANRRKVSDEAALLASTTGVENAYGEVVEGETVSDAGLPSGAMQVGKNISNSLLPVCVPATWDGIVDICHSFYPRVLPDLIRHLDEFRTHPVNYYESLAGVRFLTVKNSPSRFMDDTRFLALKTPRSAWETRLFLYCELRLLELFVGDGYTSSGQDVNREGFVRLREFVCENVLLGPLLEARVGAVLKLRVDLPAHLLGVQS